MKTRSIFHGRAVQAGFAPLALAVLLAMHASAIAAVLVSFQEGDLRTNGAVVSSAYAMHATYLRSDQPGTVKDGTNLIAGTQVTGNKMRPVVAFDVSYLTNLVGTNFARIDSAALVLTHEGIAGAGNAATFSLHVTRPFNETSATWNDPHGDATNPGGFLGTELRQRSCINTSVAPARETWGSPASAWADGGSGADLVVQAVRDALTNSSKTLALLVRRTSETSADYYSRFKHDNDATVDYRPELLVGIDSLTNPLPSVSVLAPDAVAAESGGDVAVFTIARSGVTNTALTVAFTLGGAAVLGVDYTVSSTGSVFFAAGVTTALITVTPVNDALVEADETVVITLDPGASHTLNTSTATATILDDDAPHPLATYGFNENNNAAPALSAVAVAAVYDVARVSAGNATAGVGFGQFGSGTNAANMHGYGTGGYVSAPAGFYVRGAVTSGTLPDALAADDYLGFLVGPRLGNAVDFGSVSVRAKFQAPTNLTATFVLRSSADGFSNDLAAITVSGNNSVNTFALLTNLVGGPALTQVIEPVEFRLYMFDDTESSGEIMRVDDVMFFGNVTNLPPGLQIVTLTASDPLAAESGGDAGAFTLQRIGDTNGALEVFYSMSGSASNGVDYASLPGAITFPPGVTNVVIAVNPLNDNRAEPDESVVLTLNASAAFAIVGPSSATVTIVDDNDPPEFTVTATTPLAYEPVAAFGGVFTVTRALGDTNPAVVVQFAFGGTATGGADYVAGATNSIAFAAGQMVLTIVITPVDDVTFEPPETVVLNLLPGAGYSVGGDAATVTVFDDEGVANAGLLVEAESFGDLGGWVVDQQFVDLMGSPYLLAHGKGRPVTDARTTVQFPVAGAYRLWVRTKDWTAPLPDHPGRFKVVVGGVEAVATFGTVGQGWLWQDGGMVMVTNTITEILLRDLTGFEGRCDAVFFTTDPTFVPTNTPAALNTWRRAQHGWPDVPPSAGQFDLVVVGGGIAGSCAAIAAARQGLQVALIHDRPFPGGNASQDVRVHTLGINPGGIVDEVNTPDLLIGSDQFKQTDQVRLQVLLAETNLHLFTNWRAFAVQTNGPQIASVDARHTHTGAERRFFAPLFVDSTGDGWIGYWAGAAFRRGREARSEFNESLAPLAPDLMSMGMTISWNSKTTPTNSTFPAVPWATNVAKDYVATRGDWWWEYGLLRDTIYDGEEIRDHLLRAIYGSFANAKRLPANTNRELDWVGHIGGKRESRRFVGDHTLIEADVRNHPVWPDAVVREARDIDIHYPIGGAYDWQTYAQFTPVSDYWIPFRCLYSTNIDNLMLAGRCFSATHVGLGSPRVMNTCGQMGVAVGNAAALCKKYNASPRGVARRMPRELQQLINITSWFDTPSNTVAIVDNADAARVELAGTFNRTTAQAGYYGPDFLLDGNTNKGVTSIRFRPDVPMRGLYRVYLRWTVAADRSDSVPVDVIGAAGTNTVFVDQTFGGSWSLLGSFEFGFGNAGSIRIRTENTFGQVAADALALAADFPLDPAFNGTPWQDDDGDGVFNYVEFLHGTNPRDVSSMVRIRMAGQGGGTLLRFPVQAGQSFTVQFTDDLAGGSWQKLADVPAGAFTREVEVAAPAAAVGARYYRLVSPATP